jgi:site-specific DNA recombinase
MNLGVIRLSDLKGDAQTGPLRQRQDITKKFAELGVSPEDITWAEDLDVSAFHVPPLKRPHLRRAFEALPRESTVVFYRLDRFVRRVIPDFADMISWAADRKVKLVSATENLDLLGLTGQIGAMMLAFVAQMESENASARVTNTQAYFRQIGRWRGGPLAYGYRPTRIEGRPGWWLELDPETALLIRSAVQRILEGHAVNSVAIWLNEQGALTPLDRARVIQDPPRPRLCECGHDEHDRACEKIHKCHHRKKVDGKSKKLHEYDQCSQPCPEYQPRTWKRASVFEILRSPALCGYTVKNKTEIVRDDQGIPVSFAEGVIDFETWQLVQARLDGRKVKKVRTQSPSLLLNIGFCDCGEPLYLGNKVRINKNGDEKVYEYYRHRSRACNGSSVIPVAVLDGLIQRELLKTLGDRETLRKEESTEQRNATEGERRLVAAQIVELTQDMFMRGRPRENHHELMEQLQARHAELTEALDSDIEPETRLVPTGILFRDWWASMDTVNRRFWLMEAGVTVVAVRGRMLPLDFTTRPPLNRSLIGASDGDVYASIHLGNLGEILRRAEGNAVPAPQ